MFQLIFQKIVTAFITAVIGITGLLNPAPIPEPVELPVVNSPAVLEIVLEDFQNQIDVVKEKIIELQMSMDEGIQFGAFNPTGGKRYKLAGSGITSSVTSITLTSLQYPVNDLEIAMTEIGAIGYATIEPGNASKIEFISFTGISQNASNDQATLSGVSRGLDFKSPYTASTTLASSHSGGSRIIFSNSPAFYSQMAVLQNTESITGLWTFDDANWPKIDASAASPSADGEFATKKYADDLTNAGASDMTTTTAGIAEIADTEELINFTTTTGATNRQLLIRAYRHATSTDKLGATTTVVMTRATGYISQLFLNLAEAWIFTVATTTMASTTIVGDAHIGRNLEVDGKVIITTIGSSIASSTFTGTSTFNGIPELPNYDPSGNNQATRKSYVDVVRSPFHIDAFGNTTSTHHLLATSTPATVSATSTTPTKVKEFTTYLGGALHLTFEMRCELDFSGSRAQVYRNGTAVGTSQTVGGVSWTPVRDTITGWSPNDKIQIYAWGSGSCTATGVRDVSIYSSFITVDIE